MPTEKEIEVLAKRLDSLWWNAPETVFQLKNGIYDYNRIVARHFLLAIEKVKIMPITRTDISHRFAYNMACDKIKELLAGDGK